MFLPSAAPALRGFARFALQCHISPVAHLTGSTPRWISHPCLRGFARSIAPTPLHCVILRPKESLPISVILRPAAEGSFSLPGFLLKILRFAQNDSPSGLRPFHRTNAAPYCHSGACPINPRPASLGRYYARRASPVLSLRCRSTLWPARSIRTLLPLGRYYARRAVILRPVGRRIFPFRFLSS